ncbi:2-oxo acid dehydrogenase subunit E2 [Marinilongibacter aquaticus]|uniref:2-oxo acid dehydrogenase subunit E2 n=1 Tax=Marinilongibacter aquaticus TaxID=2975157 RepID=UPI0021BD98BE|nr:2-oxo acid dehydrogenase subunit E2 [Marinilongibacter aquaticus]UBM58973.1 2-oxo acid dehydrogenase subunit E2 [Marinilongibacter aquaticus]
MAEVIRMPKMSDTMEEGVIAAWNVKVGDKVSSGDILAEVETDKATMDMESYYDGTILYIGVQKGDAVPVNGILAVVGDEGEEFESLLKGDGAAAEAKAEEPAKSETPAAAPAEKIDTSGINAQLVKMPLLSDTMTEGVIHSWLKKVGDSVSSGDILAEIETDKATMELESYEDGELLYIGVKEGDAAPVNSVIAVIGEKGADYETLLKADAAASSAPAAEEKTEAAPAPKAEEPSKSSAPAAASSQPVSSSNSNGRILASPLAKRLAEEKGIDLQAVSGSGEGGRIIKADVDNFVPAAAPAPVAASGAVLAMPSGTESSEEIKLSQMRKAIAKSLAASQSSAVTFQLTMEINMDKAMKARASMNEISPVKISFNDLVVKACGVALRKHPNVNSSWRDDHIHRNHHVHIGMAVAIEDGLVVPVIRFADTLPLSVLAATTKDLGGKAKSGKLQPADWEGNTFTVSNLGMFGIEQFTSIINNPKNESCILSVGGIKETVAVRNGEFYATNIMKVTMTCDHRVVDGATGAAFLVTLKQLLEDPARMLV